MHTQQQLQDIGLLNKGLQLLGIDVSLRISAKLQCPVRCRYISNEDGSLRWLWPESSRRPQMLRFHYAIGTKGKWAEQVIKAGFKLGVPGLVSSGKIVLYTNAIGERQLRQVTDWAITTGRSGVNRKLIIWHQDKAGNSAFTKLSLSINAAKSIYVERMAIQETGPTGVAIPQTIDTRCLAFTQQDLFEGKKCADLREVSDIPVGAMQRWLGHNVRVQQLSEASWYREAQAWLQTPKRRNEEHVSEVLLQKMRTLMDCMLPQAMVPVARAHGDFTPWNVRKSGEELLLIDWERSRDDLPALYDLFHFIYQNNILAKGNPFAVIRREIDETLRLPEWESFLLEHDIDPGEAEQQYLLSSISVYLQEYAKQVRWHHKTSQLLQTWCEALGFWMDYEGLLTQRQIILQDVVHFLNDKPYAAINLAVQDITSLPLAADLELCLSRNSMLALIGYLRQHRCVERIRERNRDCMRQVSVFLTGGSSFHLKCINELRVGSLVFADAEHVWSNARLNEAGIKQPSIADDFRNTRLFYLLKGLAIPSQIRDFYLGQNITTQFELLQQTGAIEPDKTLGSLLQYDEAEHAQSILQLKKRSVNSGLRGIWHSIQHGFDILRTMVPQRGFIITFSGVDTAGKRTVIEATRHRIRQELRVPIVVLPHRPRLLSVLKLDKNTRREQSEWSMSIPKRDSRTPSVPGRALSFLDYLLAQLYVQLRYVMRGYVVIYDHYFDLVSNGKSKVTLPAVFTSWWYRFLLKPDLNFLLYAPVDVIRQRKQELSPEDIEKITGQYLALFDKLERKSGQGHYISVRNMRLGDTLETLFHHIKSHQVGAAA